ncbi:carbonic anhydrase 4-like [Carcharodon carcharias]|uniref:carbonic anhydrase 4-like n=1 Tax=Carcharodon carcharias TaxID=13397 RepID=UPI001B7E795A|nr:carbonic anhydrase 4-like [Carcharodon carcharias]
METAMLFVLLGLGLSQVESATDGFCYYQTSCGPTSWPVTYPTCQGTEQSPINIQKNRTIRDEHLGEFKFHQYDNRQFLTQIKHTKMSVKVRVKPGMELSGGGLRAVYLVSQFHLHWGQNISAQGSEHMLDGKRASMELHIVHRQKNLTLEEAFKHRQGLAVLAFFIEIESGIAEDPAWRNLTRTIKYLKEDGDHYDLNETVSLMDLINTVNLTKYYRYNGSLTTPECNEVVVWTVFEETHPPECITVEREPSVVLARRLKRSGYRAHARPPGGAHTGVTPPAAADGYHLGQRQARASLPSSTCSPRRPLPRPV